MAKKTQKHRKSRRRTRKVKRGGANSLPLTPPNSAFPHSTAGENSDNLMGYKSSAA